MFSGSATGSGKLSYNNAWEAGMILAVFIYVCYIKTPK